MSDVPSVVYRSQSQGRRSKAFRVTGPACLAVNTQSNTTNTGQERLGGAGEIRGVSA